MHVLNNLTVTVIKQIRIINGIICVFETDSCRLGQGREETVFGTVRVEVTGSDEGSRTQKLHILNREFFCNTCSQATTASIIAIVIATTTTTTTITAAAAASAQVRMHRYAFKVVLSAESMQLPNLSDGLE